MSMIGNYIALDEKKLRAIAEGEADLSDLDTEDCETMSIDKSWHAILYLLCANSQGGEPPMSYAVPLLENQMLDCETDYGAFYLSGEQVKEASLYLNSLQPQDVRANYDFDAMVQDDVYPVQEGEDPEEFYQYVYEFLVELKEFYCRAAAAGNGIIFFIM